MKSNLMKTMEEVSWAVVHDHSKSEKNLLIEVDKNTKKLWRI